MNCNLLLFDDWMDTYDQKPAKGWCVDVWGVVLGGYHSGEGGRITDVFYDRETDRWWMWENGGHGKVFLEGLNITHWRLPPSPPVRQ